MSENKLRVKQAVILAGGRGTRLAEQTHDTPKPLVRVGNIPIITHIMNHLIAHGVEHIVIAGGYKIDHIRKYFMSEEFRYQGSVTITSEGVVSQENSHLPNGLKSLVIADTGLNTGTAQRIKKSQEYLQDPEAPFIMTYGDTVSDVNLYEVMDAFEDSKHLLTLTAVPYQERFGILKLNQEESNQITQFAEKSMSTDEFINGGFMVLGKEIPSLIEESDDDFSSDTLPRLQEAGIINAYIHKGFWAAMDTQRDNEKLNALYDKKPELFYKK